MITRVMQGGAKKGLKVGAGEIMDYDGIFSVDEALLMAYFLSGIALKRIRAKGSVLNLPLVR